MAKIALELDEAVAQRRVCGTPGRTAARVIAHGAGWTVADVVCTCGPADRIYEERHRRYAIAIVLAGSFQYRTQHGSELMTSGSLMLGNDGDGFECGHRHGDGDRCVSFWFTPDYFERVAADAGARPHNVRFRVSRVPALRALSQLVARAADGVIDPAGTSWDELAVRLAARTVTLTAGLPTTSAGPPLNAEARVSRVIRTIDRHPDAALPFEGLARVAGLSPYHFLRTFKRVTGVTPHQYVLRARLREAACRLTAGTAKVVDVALDCGFGDVSNFNRAFRSEFGIAPVAFRRTTRGRVADP